MEVFVETVIVVEMVTVKVTLGGTEVVVVVVLAIDVVVFVTAGRVVVLLMEAVFVIVFVVTCSTSFPQSTEVGYSCDLQVTLSLTFDSVTGTCWPLAASPKGERPLILGE